MANTVAIQPSVPANLLNNVAIGIQNGNAFALPAAGCLVSWQVILPVAPASITVELQASNNGTNFAAVDTSTSTLSGNIRSTFIAARFVRAVITASSGGTFVTVIINCAPMSADIFSAVALLAQQSASQQTIADTNPTVLFTYTLPANTLIRAGKTIKIRIWGVCAANANVKTVVITFGADSYTVFSGAVNGSSFWAEYTIMRRPVQNTQTRIGRGGFAASLSTAIVTTLGIAETAAIVITVTATNGVASAGDIVLHAAIVDTE